LSTPVGRPSHRRFNLPFIPHTPQELLDFERTFDGQLDEANSRLLVPLEKAKWLSSADKAALVRPLKAVRALQRELLQIVAPLAAAAAESDKAVGLGRAYAELAPQVRSH
jgi:hypothetical protein